MKKALVFGIFFLVSLFLAPSTSLAQFETAENISLSISNLAVVNNTIIAKLKIENPSANSLKNVYISAVLTTSSPPATASDSSALVTYLDSEQFTLNASSNMEKEISLPLTQNIPSGKYALNIQLKDQNTQTLRFTSTEAFLNGNNKFLTINLNSCVLKVNNVIFPAGQGALVKANTAPSAECSVTNSGSQPMTVRTKVNYAERFVIGHLKAVHEYSPKETITFNPGETKKVSTVLPAIYQPQVYEGLWYLIDSNSVTVSVMAGFRWTIEGASARVEYIKLDKDYYGKGDTAQVEAKALSSMDLYWRDNGQPKAGTDLKNPVLAVQISSGENQCGQAEVKLLPTTEGAAWPVQKLSIPISQDCPNPVAKAEVKEGEQLLAAEKTEYQSSETKLTASLKQNYLGYFLGGVVVIVLVGGIGWIIYRKKTGSPPTPPPSPTVQNITAGLLVITLITLSGVTLKQFNILQKISEDITVLAQFSGKSVRVQGQYGSTTVNGGTIDFWGVVSDFSQNGGQSQFTIPIDCSKPPSITVYGYTGASYACENAPTHLIYNYFLDGQPINIASSTSPDSSLVSSGNRLEVRSPQWSSGFGPRTSTVYFQGGQLPYETTHTFTAQFYVQGGYDQQAISNTGSINVQFICKEPCPDGQTNPHGTCDGKSCIQVNSCGVTTCGNNVDCGGCLPGQQQPHLACVNQSCQQVDACGTNTCASDQDCCPAGQITPHLACVNQSCQPVNTCGASTCATTNDCCPAGQVAPHQECNGTNCKTVDSCGPPIVCTKPGETVPHGECDGVSCKQVNTCGVTSCTENKQCFSDDMCKCDGFNAINLKNPSSSQFEFEAFAKVEGTDVSKAKVDSIQFRMMKSGKSNPNTGTIVATSDLMKPEIVSSTNTKVRFRSSWKVNPPSYDPNATYRVFSTIKCAPKAASSSASLNQALALSRGEIYSSESQQVLGQSSNYSTERLVQNNNLELDTMSDAYYTKIIETDACSAIRFEYGQY